MTAIQIDPRFEPRLVRNEPMSKHTSWQVGGPAELWFTPADVAELSDFLRLLPAGVPVTWVGLGSNLLVRDGGIRGAVIHVHGIFNGLDRVSDCEVRAEVGVACARLGRRCAKWLLGPAEFFTGIPGSVGGALAMNAGAWGGETWRHVVSVEVINRAGERRVRLPAEYQVGYRRVVAPVADEWFLAATLRFEHSPDSSNASIRELLERRMATQPLDEKSCGSVFTNPPGDHSARLIETAGLKGHRLGGASVSTKHANFIINHGEASAADIEALLLHVQATVERVHGVRLHPEVRILGEAA